MILHRYTETCAGKDGTCGKCSIAITSEDLGDGRFRIRIDSISGRSEVGAAHGASLALMHLAAKRIVEEVGPGDGAPSDNMVEDAVSTFLTSLKLPKLPKQS
jgi:hypothetical protein